MYPLAGEYVGLQVNTPHLRFLQHTPIMTLCLTQLFIIHPFTPISFAGKVCGAADGVPPHAAHC